MKSLKCDLCEISFEAKSFDSWLEQMKPHYMQNHQDFMQANAKKGAEGMKAWMLENKARFDAA